MRFLVSTNIEPFRSVLKDDVVAHASLCSRLSELDFQLRDGQVADVWICDGEEATSERLDIWFARSDDPHKTLLVRDPRFLSYIKNLSGDRLSNIAVIPKSDTISPKWAISALRLGEMLHIHALTSVPTKKPNHADQLAESVVLVGAGIMNLIAAELLASRGYLVKIIDAGPDPRVCKDWTKFGVTNGGGDARMFTYTEADNYNEAGSDIYHDMRRIFRTTTLRGGWSVADPSSFSAAERDWIKSFESVPVWMAQGMKEDIYFVNGEAGKLWDDLRARAPEIFEGVSLRQDIMRWYAEDVALAAASKLNESLHALIGEISPADLLMQDHGLSSAIAGDHLAGGLSVEGFTLRIHAFVGKLIQRIVSLGGNFVWDCPVRKIERDASGDVVLLRSEAGPLYADHFIISTGVTRDALLDNTASKDLIQGVLGVWLNIPNLDRKVQHSIKIHRRGSLVEDINVTVSSNSETGEETLILGGGYGYVGHGFPSINAPEMTALFDELENVAKIYFPAQYASGKERGTLWPGGQRKYCIRPFTCTGLGVFEDIPTVNGGHLIVTGGNNTGGFAQAPAVARAIHRSLRGEFDPIHVLFHPYRSRLTARDQTPFANESTEPLRPTALL